MGSDLTFIIYKEGKWLEIPKQEAVNFTLRQISGNPVVLRFNMDGEDQYFTADGEVWALLEGQGKIVRHVGELFEAQRRELVRMGFEATTSIYDWSLDWIFRMQTTFTVFPAIKEIKPATIGFS